MSRITAAVLIALVTLAAAGRVASADRARLDIPGEAACIKIGWEDDDPTRSARQYGVRNTCDHAVMAYWCTGDECHRPTEGAMVAAGTTVKRWVQKQKGQHVNVVAACALKRGDDAVQFDPATNRCWANVTY